MKKTVRPESVEKAVSLYRAGFSCSQAVFAAHAERFKLSRDLALKLTTGFGGGMARQGLTCGAVTGGIMVIGLKYGRILPDDQDSKERTYRLVLDFVNRFKQMHGHVSCKALLGCDIDTPEGHRQAEQEGLFESHCPRFVEDAASLIEEILESFP
jgi:C_GCAxxG_C_C family probable redox protein